MVKYNHSSSGTKVDLLSKIAKATDLREGRAGVALIVRSVFRSGPLPLKDLARIVRMPLPVVSAVRRELEAVNLFKRGQGVELTPSGRSFAEDVLGLTSSYDPNCPHCVGRGMVIAPSLQPILDSLNEHAADGPRVDVTIDQAPCTPETALFRALAMHEAGAVEGNSIICIGDDDSISLSLALLGRTLGIKPRRLAVIDIDEMRLDHLARSATKYELEIELVHHDLRDPLPKYLVENFDVFQTDPPYTLEGMSLFLTRAIESLHKDTGLSGFLSYANLSPNDMLNLQAGLTEMGLAITRVRPSFNTYQGASILGSLGQLIDLKTTSNSMNLTVRDRYEGLLYTGEVRPRKRRYRCITCKTTIHLGLDQQVNTIEELKSLRCPSCGGTTFRRR